MITQQDLDRIKAIVSYVTTEVFNNDTDQNLTAIKEATETGDVVQQAKVLFDTLGLEKLFKELNLPIPSFEKQTDKEDLTEGVKPVSKDQFYWF